MHKELLPSHFPVSQVCLLYTEFKEMFYLCFLVIDCYIDNVYFRSIIST
jgi:hypothetical protein